MGTYPYTIGLEWSLTVSDANIRIPAEARDRLARVAAAEGLSLRAYLARLAENVLTPEERAERAEKARAVLHEWGGYNHPSDTEIEALDAELDRRLNAARAT